MSHIWKASNARPGEYVELADAKRWSTGSDGLEEEGGNSEVQPFNKTVEADEDVSLEHHEDHSSPKLEPFIQGGTWKSSLRKSLRLNKHAVMNMSLSRALILVSLSIFFVLTTSLLVTGYQGLLPSLLEDGVYANLCDPIAPITPETNLTTFDHNVKDGRYYSYFIGFSRVYSLEYFKDYFESSLESSPSLFTSSLDSHGIERRSGTPIDYGGRACNKQRLRLNLMLSVAVTALNLVCFPLGLLVDRIGPRWVGLAGSIVSVLGTVLFAFSNSIKFDAYIPGYTLLGLGGVSIFMSLLHLLNVFPERRGILTTLYTATEDASTGVFYFFGLLHKAGISLKTLFLSYSIIPLTHLGVVLLQPAKPIINEKSDQSHAEYYPVSQFPLKQQALSIQYIIAVVWNCTLGVSTYFYLSTLNAQLVWLFGSQTLANRGTEIFSFLFMICPFVAVPFTGWMLDKWGTWPSLLFVALQCLIYGITASIRIWWIQWITWATFVVTRASFIGVSAHWINQMFGQNFSTLIGMLWTAGGLANFSMYLWAWIALEVFKSQFLIMNWIMTAVAVFMSVLAAFVVRRSLGQSPHQPISQIESPFNDHHLDDIHSDLSYNQHSTLTSTLSSGTLSDSSMDDTISTTSSNGNLTSSSDCDS